MASGSLMCYGETLFDISRKRAHMQSGDIDANPGLWWVPDVVSWLFLTLRAKRALRFALTSFSEEAQPRLVRLLFLMKNVRNASWDTRG